MSFDARFEGLEVFAPEEPAFEVLSTGVLGVSSLINGKPTYEVAITTRLDGAGLDREFRVNTGGTLNWNGGCIAVSGIGPSNYRAFLMNKGANINITDGWLRSNGNQIRWGEEGTGDISGFHINRLIVEKLSFTIFGVFGSLQGLSPFGGLVQIVSYGTFTSFTLSDFNPLDNTAGCDNWDVDNVFLDNPLSTDINLSSGESEGLGGSNRFISVRKYLNVTALNAAGSPVENARVYVRDTNNGARVAVINIAGQTSDNVYVQSTNVSGLTPDFFVYVLHGKSALTGNSQPVIRDYRTKTTTPGADLFDLHLWSYGNNYRNLNNTALKGTGVLSVAATLLSDTNVTLSESAAVAKLASSFTVSGNTITVTADSNGDDIYDALKAWKTRPVAAQLEYPTIGVQPVTSNGLTASTAMTIVVDNCILSPGAKHKSVATTSTFTFINGGAPSATLLYSSSAGPNAVLLIHLPLASMSVIVQNNSGTTVQYLSGQSGDYSLQIAPGATGTWRWAVNKQGYAFATGSFTPGVGGLFEVSPACPQVEKSDGSPAYLGTTSALVTISFAGATPRIQIGNGQPPLQAIYDETEDGLITQDGMEWLVEGGDSVAIFDGPAGDFLFMTNGYRLQRRLAGDINATVPAFVQSTDGVIVDEVNGPVQFLSSDSTTAIAAAVWAAVTRTLTAGTKDTEIDRLHTIHGLAAGLPLVVTDTSRTAGSIEQTIVSDGTSTTLALV